MNILKRINSRLTFPMVKLFAIFSAVLLLSLSMGYDSRAEVTQEKVVSPRVRPAPVKRVITRVHSNVRRLDAKPPTQPPRKSEEPIEYEVEVSEYVPKERRITIERKISAAPVYLAPASMSVTLTREEIQGYIEDLKYGETIDDKINAARALGGGAVRQYIHNNDTVIDEVYNALAAAFRQNNDERLLKNIAVSFTHLGKEEAGNILFNYLITNNNSSIKMTIIRSLGRLKYRGAVSTLTSKLRSDNDPDIRAQSAAALGMIGDRSAGYALITALNDDDYYVAKAAIEALGKIGSTEAKYPLMNILNHDEDLELREAAARALRKIEN